MQLSLLQGRDWLREVWQRKTSLLAGVLAIVSLSLAHYAGFLMQVPTPILAVAGGPLASGVTATFLFYVFFCAVCARVFISVLQLIMLPALAFSDRLGWTWGRQLTWQQQRRFVRSHSRTIRYEGFAWIAMQSILFLFMMLAIYVEFTFTWVSGAVLAVSIPLVVLSGLVRSGYFLQPARRIFMRKIKARRLRFGQAVSAAFVTTTAALIVVAFAMGIMRASLLRSQTSHKVVTKHFEGTANVIASSDGVLLLYQKAGADFRYLYFCPEFTTSVETRPVFPPIGSKKET